MVEMRMFESLMIQLEVENHEQLTQVIKRDEKNNTKVILTLMVNMLFYMMMRFLEAHNEQL
jgi:hypothetical protein